MQIYAVLFITNNKTYDKAKPMPINNIKKILKKNNFNDVLKDTDKFYSRAHMPSAYFNIAFILALMTYKHKDNIVRLKQGTERKITWM